MRRKVSISTLMVSRNQRRRRKMSISGNVEHMKLANRLHLMMVRWLV
jgi:hypothetical protein